MIQTKRFRLSSKRNRIFSRSLYHREAIISTFEVGELGMKEELVRIDQPSITLYNHFFLPLHRIVL